MGAVNDFVTPGGLRVEPTALAWTASRSGGPGGQHANTSDTAVTVTVEVSEAGLPPVVRDRIVAALGPTVTARAADTRSQWRNRQLAWQRLATRLDAAATPPPLRRPTKPRRAAGETRLADKRRRSEVKRRRRSEWQADEA
ncbi:MAG: aminoacyl-tRNA hydrolase [Acidimicrobiia bacterium]|nr:aminoacyl-tRNA hydrolase [Acidimicrobiia bacterium]